MILDDDVGGTTCFENSIDPFIRPLADLALSILFCEKNQRLHPLENRSIHRWMVGLITFLFTVLAVEVKTCINYGLPSTAIHKGEEN